jgi:hypothetical protein
MSVLSEHNTRVNKNHLSHCFLLEYIHCHTCRWIISINDLLLSSYCFVHFLLVVLLFNEIKAFASFSIGHSFFVVVVFLKFIFEHLCLSYSNQHVVVCAFVNHETTVEYYHPVNHDETIRFLSLKLLSARLLSTSNRTITLILSKSEDIEMIEHEHEKRSMKLT